ncbi:hydrogenase expression/formation protein HypE [Helicobacter zhangjianzhongii]|uniref:Hydrogenase expression/formation protein HypE n=1 Tax=Helicobacter zhangjianzhongii TaxID=2974574 RepID=A0ACC6FUC9_9HELI|nr:MULTISPECIES: hydrogenase expression/formation protein HypE [unclassified Helicobacter]MDL0080778.1 hydrogenase expression/formation protein HypE [Helicobacter sp. CPD2-1]MDL0082697.1 hydrogenase expression/formation protein HypE [Helicobacter sp. XJK30-2]
METITLAQGGGGVATNALVERVFLTHLREFFVSLGEDAGVFSPHSAMACSTDSFVITPVVFAGGDIGKLSVCGSSNDVAMMGAKPVYINFGFMLEEGLEIALLESIIQSIAKELRLTGLKILSADTKVLPKGSIDKLFINTTCLGEILLPNVSTQALSVGDSIIVSAPIGAHGASIFAARENIKLESSVQSDCAQLYPMLAPLFAKCPRIHTMRDATRGGLSAVLHEWVQDRELCIELDEGALPIDEGVQGICEILGLEPSHLANEGVCVLAVDKSDTQEVCDILRGHSLGSKACVIGEVYAASKQTKSRVVLINEWGGKRFMEYPQGELLPRIC